MRIGDGYIGEETKLGMKTDFLNVNLTDVGMVQFTTNMRATRSEKTFDAQFTWNEQTIHATLFVNDSRQKYLVNYTKMSGGQKTVANEYDGETSTNEAKNVLMRGWSAFLMNMQKSAKIEANLKANDSK